MRNMSWQSPIQRALQLCMALLIAFPFTGAFAQSGNVPSANCHVTDGQFTSCGSGGSEWSDVTPIFFPGSNSYLYVNQDPGRQFIWLLYDFPFQTTPIGDTDSVRISFDTVETAISGASLEHYDIDLFGNGQIQVNVFGQPEAPGRIAGTVGFSPSPNSPIPHLIAELQVPLTPGTPTSYSPDPIFWGASPPAPPPPPPCPTEPGKSLTTCQKANYRTLSQVFFYTGTVLGAISLACTSATLGICAPLSVPVGLTGLVYGAASFYAADKINDPPDPNFTLIDQPVVVPIAQLQAGPGITQQEADAFNALFADLAQELALDKASNTAINRAEGAREAGNVFWEQQQTQAAQQFLQQAAPFYSAQPQLLSNLASALQAAGIQLTFTASDITAFQAELAANGLSPAMTDQLNQLGIDSAGQAQILQSLLSADPETGAQLGVGAFPQMLTDPTIGNAIEQLSGILNQAAPTVANLVPFISTTLPGDYVASGVGLRGTTGGNIIISGIPSGASIQNAYLYWGMLDNGEDASLRNLTLNGSPVLGVRIGHGPDTCWGRTDSFSYRADVTPLVTGNGTYSLTNVAEGGNILAEGAALVVVYNSGGTSFRTVMLSDGNIVLPAVFQGQALFGGFDAAAPVSAKTTFMVGDGQGFGDPAFFTGSNGTATFSNPFVASEGLYWDTLTFDVSAEVAPGISPADSQISLSSDCLLWPAQAFSVSSPQPAPLPGTAAVVKATTDGHTAIDPRGLALTDVPSITDRIAAIVQSRFIEDPSLNPSDLASQLANSVPAAFLPPGGATAVVQAVLSTVNKPTPHGDTTPPTITITAPTATNYVLNQMVAANYGCSDTGSGVATCIGTVNNGSNINTAAVGTETFTVKATDVAGNAASQSVNYNVGYRACLLYDPTHAAKSGSTIPIKFQLCDAAGNDVSSPGVTVNATNVVMISTDASFTVDDSGNANPDSNFRFDGTLGPTGGYIFNLQTTGLATGTYVLTFTVAGDPTTHTTELMFQVR
jgi:hypothetical protein